MTTAPPTGGGRATTLIEAASVHEPGSITEPGVYEDVPAEIYHADPVRGGSLSSTGARRLLAPSCPALFHHERTNPPAPKRHFDLGTAAHQMVLGSGPEIVRINAPDYRTKAAQEQKKTAHAAGAVPLLDHEYEQVEAMAAALRAHPVAGALFAAGSGLAEQTLVWRDRATGVMCRARLDWLRHRVEGERLLVPDYKTANAVDLDSIQKSIHNYGYHQQAEWYLEGVRALGLGSLDAVFLLVFQMKEPPYLVTVVELGSVALQIAADRNREARETYAECSTSGRWPAFSDGIELVQLPAWVESNYLREITR